MQSRRIQCYLYIRRILTTFHIIYYIYMLLNYYNAVQFCCCHGRLRDWGHIFGNEKLHGRLEKEEDVNLKNPFRSKPVSVMLPMCIGTDTI